jgi:hypothetical protein
MKYARIRPTHHYGYPPIYHRQWFPVLDRHPVDQDEAEPGYVWVKVGAKVRYFRLEELEFIEKPEERRRPGRLKDEELEVKVEPNAAGGVTVKASHRPTRRFATGAGEEPEKAKRKAIGELTNLVRRVSWRRRQGLSDS